MRALLLVMKVYKIEEQKVVLENTIFNLEDELETIVDSLQIIANKTENELIFEVAAGEHEKLEVLVRREMGSAYPLKAPLDVNIGFGKSWDLAAH